MKNDFAPPQAFNAELYQEIRNQGQDPEEERPANRPPQRRRMRRRRDSDDAEFGSYQPTRRHFRNRGPYTRRPIEVSEGLRHHLVGWNNAQQNTTTRNDLEERISESESSSSEEVLPPENQKLSRSDRLRLRQTIMENGRVPAGIKYKPSPQKKEPKDLRGQWRAIKRITEAAEEQGSWRLFDRQDVASHEQVSSLLHIAKSVPAPFDEIDPFDVRKRPEQEKPKYYDRRLKKPVFEQPQQEGMKEDSPEEEGIQEDSEEEFAEEQSAAESGQQEQIEREESESSVHYEEEESEFDEGIEEEEEEQESESEVFKSKRPVRRQVPTRANKPIAKKRVVKKKNTKRVIKRKQKLTKKVTRQMKNKVQKIPKTPLKIHQSLKGSHSKIADKPLPKRQPRKVIDFDFDRSGKKVIITEANSEINKQISSNMVKGKVAGKSQDKKKAQSASRSCSNKKRASSSVKQAKKNTPKTPVKESALKTRKTLRNPKIAKEKSPITTKSVKSASKPSNKAELRDSISPAKGGVANLLGGSHITLHPLVKKDKNEDHKEFFAIRKLAEAEDAKEKRGMFKFGSKKGVKPHAKPQRFRSRELEKYEKGKPIQHSMRILGNLSMVTYHD